MQERERPACKDERAGQVREFPCQLPSSQEIALPFDLFPCDTCWIFLFTPSLLPAACCLDIPDACAGENGREPPSYSRCWAHEVRCRAWDTLSSCLLHALFRSSTSSALSSWLYVHLPFLSASDLFPLPSASLASLHVEFSPFHRANSRFPLHCFGRHHIKSSPSCVTSSLPTASTILPVPATAPNPARRPSTSPMTSRRGLPCFSLSLSLSSLLHPAPQPAFSISIICFPFFAIFKSCAVSASRFSPQGAC